jgi:hypothetical protein
MEDAAHGTVMAATIAKPSDAASWAAQGESTFEKGTEFSMSTSVENKVELPQEDSVSMPKQGPADLQSTKALVSNGDDSEINKCPGPIRCQTTKPCLPCSPMSARPLKGTVLQRN